MTDRDQIVYAAGHDWEEAMPASEWSSLSMRQKTEAIVLAWSRHELQKRPDPEDLRERLLAGVETEWLADLVWEAWQALPYFERAVLNSLGVRCVEADIENGTRGLATTSTADSSKLLKPIVEIVLDPQKYEGESELRTLRTIFHEFCHIAYRHSEMRIWLQPASPAWFAPALDLITETHAESAADRWLELLQERRNRQLSGGINGTRKAA